MTTVRERALNASRAAREKALARGPSRSSQIRSDREMQRIYWVWGAMCKRCHNENDKAYKNYGGRGIFVCDAWRNSFETFLSDMGMRPSPSVTIERINNDSGYSPSNCKWATHQEQSLNKRLYKNSPICVRGVSPRDNGTFRVRIRRFGKIVFDKTCPTIENAIRARNAALSEGRHAAG